MNNLPIQFELMPPMALTIRQTETIANRAANPNHGNFTDAPTVFEIAALLEDHSLPTGDRKALITKKVGEFLLWHRERSARRCLE